MKYNIICGTIRELLINTLLTCRLGPLNAESDLALCAKRMHATYCSIGNKRLVIGYNQEIETEIGTMRVIA